MDSSDDEYDEAVLGKRVGQSGASAAAAMPPPAPPPPNAPARSHSASAGGGGLLSPSAAPGRADARNLSRDATRGPSGSRSEIGPSSFDTPAARAGEHTNRPNQAQKRQFTVSDITDEAAFAAGSGLMSPPRGLARSAPASVANPGHPFAPDPSAASSAATSGANAAAFSTQADTADGTRSWRGRKRGGTPGMAAAAAADDDSENEDDAAIEVRSFMRVSLHICMYSCTCM